MGEPEALASAVPEQRVSVFVVFSTFLKLGLTSFGGPIAHLAYFREEFVSGRSGSKTGSTPIWSRSVSSRRARPAAKWVSGSVSLPWRGCPGAVAAWLAFTLLVRARTPAVRLRGGNSSPLDLGAGWLHGLKVVAVAVVAQAVWGMAKNLYARRATVHARDRSGDRRADMADVGGPGWPQSSATAGSPGLAWIACPKQKTSRTCR